MLFEPELLKSSSDEESRFAGQILNTDGILMVPLSEEGDSDCSSDTSTITVLDSYEINGRDNHSSSSGTVDSGIFSGENPQDTTLRSCSTGTLDEMSSDDNFSIKTPPDNNFQSSSTGTLDEVSSGIFSEENSVGNNNQCTTGTFDGVNAPLEENMPILYFGGQEIEKLYNVFANKRCREIEWKVAELTFKKLLPCEEIEKIPDSIARFPKRKDEAQEHQIAKMGKLAPYKDLKCFQLGKQGITEYPIRHCAVAVIEKMETILEMILSIGYNKKKQFENHYGKQRVPDEVYCVMCNVRAFLKPFKTLLEESTHDGYFHGFVTPLEKAIDPIFQYLMDSLMLLESPLNRSEYAKVRHLDDSESYSEGPYSEYRSRGRSGDQSPLNSSSSSNYYFNSNITRRSIRGNHARAHSWGLIEIPFSHDILVVLTINMAVMMYNRRDKVFLALSADGNFAGLKFRFGECIAENENSNILCLNNMGLIHKRVKLTGRNVSFQNMGSPVVYLLADSGVSTSCQNLFPKIEPDFIGQIFYSGSCHGQEYIRDCCDILRRARHDIAQDGTISWYIQNVKIKQSPDGQVVLHRSNAEYTVIMTPNDQAPGEEISSYSCRMTTPKVHITCAANRLNLGAKPSFYVKQDIKRMYTTDTNFIVRYKSHAAGIDENQKIFLKPNQNKS